MIYNRYGSISSPQNQKFWFEKKLAMTLVIDIKKALDYILKIRFDKKIMELNVDNNLIW